MLVERPSSGVFRATPTQCHLGCVAVIAQGKREIQALVPDPVYDALERPVPVTIEAART